MKSTCTKKEFKSWLESKSPKTIIGKSGLIDACPLARYFHSVNGLRKGRVEVEFDITLFNKDESIIKGTPIKPWMNKFISAVDKVNGEEISGVKISAKKALEILEKVK